MTELVFRLGKLDVRQDEVRQVEERRVPLEIQEGDEVTAVVRARAVRVGADVELEPLSAEVTEVRRVR